MACRKTLWVKGRADEGAQLCIFSAAWTNFFSPVTLRKTFECWLSLLLIKFRFIVWVLGNLNKSFFAPQSFGLCINILTLPPHWRDPSRLICNWLVEAKCSKRLLITPLNSLTIFLSFRLPQDSPLHQFRQFVDSTLDNIVRWLIAVHFSSFLL